MIKLQRLLSRISRRSTISGTLGGHIQLIRSAWLQESKGRVSKPFAHGICCNESSMMARIVKLYSVLTATKVVVMQI